MIDIDIDKYAVASAGCPLARRAHMTLLARCICYSSGSIVHSYTCFVILSYFVRIYSIPKLEYVHITKTKL